MLDQNLNQQNHLIHRLDPNPAFALYSELYDPSPYDEMFHGAVAEDLCRKIIFKISHNAAQGSSSLDAFRIEQRLYFACILTISTNFPFEKQIEKAFIEQFK